MQITLKWLLNHLKINTNNLYTVLKNVEISLNNLGMEIDEIKLINMLLVGHVTHVEKLPKSELYKCIVNISKLQIQELPQQFIILTKLTNMKEGMYASFVPYDNNTPDGMFIAKRMMMGHESQGMFYNEQTYECESILNCDAILNLSIPTNRNDLKNVRHIAKDLSLLYGELKPLHYNESYTNVNSIMNELKLNIESFIQKDIGVNMFYGHNEINGYKQSMNYINNIEYNDIYSVNNNKMIFLSHSVFYSITHLNVSLQTIEQLLTKAHFICNVIRQKPNNDTVHDEFGIQAQAPIWRKDIENEMYLIQEIIRLYGVNSIINNNIKFSQYNTLYNETQNIKHILISQEFTEMYNIPFETELMFDADNALQIIDFNKYLRDSLFFSLLESAKNLISFNENEVKLFECGKVYTKNSEKNRIGILMMGHESANMLHEKRAINHLHLQSVLTSLNMNITICKNTECAMKINSLSGYNYGCYCNFIHSNTIKIHRSEYTYYYFESYAQQYKKYINEFTNSMQKTYTNINLTSDTYINWSDIQTQLFNIQHKLVSNGFYREKYRMTITIAYNELDLYNKVIKNLQKLHNIIIER